MTWINLRSDQRVCEKGSGRREEWQSENDDSVSKLLMQLYAEKLHNPSLLSWHRFPGLLPELEPSSNAAQCGIHTLHPVICSDVKILYSPIRSDCGCFYTSAFSFALLDLQK